MRILADECIGRSIVERLRRDGFDVAWGAEECPGAKDEMVLARAVDARRVLLTVNKDFGEVTVRMKLPTGVRKTRSHFTTRSRV
jgi:predicted nuclease of predicted toxin-antitoxin system